MEQTKSWVRWTESNRIFPSNKYNFSHHLKRKGDYVAAYPLSSKERKKLADAAYAWAWWHKYTVKITSFPWEKKGQYIVQVLLVSKYRERDYG